MSICDDITIDYYDKHADEFNLASVNANMNSICDRFLSYLQPSASILDLGCGSGRDSLYFINKGFSVLPVDGSMEMCTLATKISGVTAMQLMFEDIDFVREFDGVWACASLLHVSKEQLPSILRKINTALKPSGILYMSFKYGEGEEERHGRYFSDMTESDLPFLCNDSTGFCVDFYDVTEDVRQDHKGERWLNIIAKKTTDF